MHARPSPARRTALTLAAASLAALALPHLASATLTITPLPFLPGGTYANGKAINASHLVIGGANSSAGDDRLYVLTPGSATPQDPGDFPGARTTNLTAVNDSGLILGNALFASPDFTSDRHTHPFLYSPGSPGYQDLAPALGYDLSTPIDMNNAGQIAGFYEDTNLRRHAFLYSPGSPAGPVDLVPPVTNGGSQPTDINNLGQVLGTADDPSLHSYTFLYTPGVGLQNLADIVGAPGYWGGQINDLGQITLTTYDDIGRPHAWLYTPGSGVADLGSLGGLQVAAASINNLGQVVGRSDLPDFSPHPFLWTPSTGMLDLNSLLPPDSGWTLTNALSITDDGTILATGYYNGVHTGLLLSLPEPTSLSLLLPTLFLSRRRTKS